MILSLFTEAVQRADASWQPILMQGLHAMVEQDAHYLPALARNAFLPTEGRLFAAFSQPVKQVRYVLVGEGPYPREASASGYCFMDGAVEDLWSEQGLSKPVNRATSLRNFIKMLLVTEGLLAPDSTSGAALAPAATQVRAVGSAYIQTLPQLQQALTQQGFLLLNAALVFRPEVAPLLDAKAWRPVLAQVFEALALASQPPTVILWGKIAQYLEGVPALDRLPKVAAEHPYNLSFIQNQAMQSLFGPMHLLRQI